MLAGNVKQSMFWKCITGQVASVKDEMITQNLYLHFSQAFQNWNSVPWTLLFSTQTRNSITSSHIFYYNITNTHISLCLTIVKVFFCYNCSPCASLIYLNDICSPFHFLCSCKRCNTCLFISSFSKASSNKITVFLQCLPFSMHCLQLTVLHLML